MSKFKKSVLLITALAVLMSSVCVCYAETPIYLTSLADCAPFSIYQQSEGVCYTVSGADSGWYTATDYFGNTAYHGEFSNGELVISDVETGHYELTVTDGNGAFATTEFAVVPDLDKRRDSTYNPLAFSAMATTTHTTNNVSDYDAYAKTISLAGVNYVREYIDWTALINNTKWLTKNKALIEAYQNNNIDVMLLMQKMPYIQTPGTEYYEKGNQLTYDLNKAYNAIKKLLEVYPSQIDAIEFENEPDLRTEKDTADRYASLLKVASIAADEINRDVKIASAGLAYAVTNPSFEEKMLQNDINDYIDIYNAHQYRAYSEGAPYIETSDDFGTFMGDEVLSYGLSDKQLWMSEYGFRAQYNDGETELSKEAQLQCARSAPIALVRASKAGLDRMFWFIHGYLKENVVYGYGTLSSTHTPNYVYSALSAFTNALGNAGYSREIEMTGANAHIYADGNEEIACVWAEDETTVSLPANNGKVIITDIMGKEIQEEVTDNSIEITIGPDIQYIRAENGFSDGAAEQIKYQKETSRRPQLTEAQKVIMTPVFEDGTELMSVNRGYALKTADNASNAVKVNVYNFNDTPVNVEVECISDGGWTIENAVQTVTVPAKTVNNDDVEGGLSTITFNVSGNSGAYIYDNTPLIFSSTVDGEKASDVVTYITSNDRNTETLFWSTSTYLWELEAAGTQNNAVSSSIAAEDSKIKMTCAFSDDVLEATEYKTCRMKYKLPFTIDENSAGLSFRCTSPQEPDVSVRIWLTDKDGDTFYNIYSVRLESDYDYTFVFPFDELRYGYGSGNGVLDTGSCNLIIGICKPNIDNVDFYFSNFGIEQKTESKTNEIAISDISYADGSLTAQLSSEAAKDARFMVLGSVYDASVTGNTATAKNVLLPKGEYTVEVFAYDAANRVNKGSGNITVSETDTPYIEKQEGLNGAVVDEYGTVTIKGSVNSRYAGKNAALIVYPDTIAAEDVSLSNLTYFNEITIGSGGEYSFTFDIKDYNSDIGYIYAINIDGEPVRSQIGNYEVVYEWSAAKIALFRTEKTVKIVTAMNFAPEDMDLVTGIYTDDGKLLKVLCDTVSANDTAQKYEVQYAVPAGAHTIKTFVWTADGSMKTLQLPYISYFK